ncbi:hypothetical protein VSU19_03690 [Verrucomicrobiales bacterium BCK34]|nr:hypothetical protein [Verrucomicrobiales bacterium BCK34]
MKIVAWWKARLWWVRWITYAVIAIAARDVVREAYADPDGRGNNLLLGPPPTGKELVTDNEKDGYNRACSLP